MENYFDNNVEKLYENFFDNHIEKLHVTYFENHVEKLHVTYFENLVEKLQENAADIMKNYFLKNKTKDKSQIAIPEDFQKEFFGLVDQVNLSLMEDRDNFYGYFLFQMSKEIRFDISSPTAINFKGAKYVIYFNPAIFLNLNRKQMESTIKHEILHVLSLHIIRAKECRNSHSTLAVNMAMDVVVNEYLNDLPPYAVTLEWVSLKFSLELEPSKSFEYYADKIQTALDLLEEEENAPENDNTSEDHEDFKNDKTHDDNSEDRESKRIENDLDLKNDLDIVAISFNPEKTHNIWEESSDIEEKTLQEFTMKITNNSEKGNIPAYLGNMIKALKNSKGELPWNVYLKRLMGTVESNKKKIITRRNRRQPQRLDLRGELRSHKANIAVALDISGSISNEEFRQAMKEVLIIVKNYNHEITVIECDNEIRRVYKVKSVKDIKNRSNHKGGTKYNPVFEYANKKKINLLVYFTDGKGEDKLRTIPVGYKVLWVISGKGDKLSLKEPYGAVKKLRIVEIKDTALEIGDIPSSGYSMNNHEK